MKSAGINFGLPRSEYIAEVNDQGEAISFRNQDTDTEYIGGESLPDISAGDAGKVLAVSDELEAEWVANPVFMVIDTNDTLNVSYNDLINMLQNNTIPYLVYAFDEDDKSYTWLLRLQYLIGSNNSYIAMFSTADDGASGWYSRSYVNLSADGNLIYD